MTDQELQTMFMEELPSVQSHLKYYSEGDDDHTQNGLTNMWSAIVTNNEKNKAVIDKRRDSSGRKRSSGNFGHMDQRSN